MPELRELFAANLRRLVEIEPSIAHVCRELELNRQQFNRYLSGDALPGKRNLRKIAGYFKVSEASLIAATADGAVAVESAVQLPLIGNLTAVFRRGAPGLRGGLYSFYFPSLAGATTCFRGLLIVKQDPPHTQFAALLNLSAAGSGWSAGNALRFNGLVRERKGRVLFLGTDRNEPDDIFIINVEPLYSSRGKLFTGLATSARADEIDARRIALEYAPDQSRICPLARKCGLVSSEDESIHPWARAAISAENAYEPLVFRPRKLNALMKT